VIAERTSKKVPETILVSQEILNDEKENQKVLLCVTNPSIKSGCSSCSLVLFLTAYL
jgi:hypothetical protein